jgi:hypothetical protein
MCFFIIGVVVTFTFLRTMIYSSEIISWAEGVLKSDNWNVLGKTNSPVGEHW